MSIPTLIQVYDDVRRLAIAGSSVAPGDFRLKKSIAPLEQAGAKAPVFAKVAQSIQALVDSTDKTAAAALLELTTLVSAVLYTQGTTGIEGEITPIKTTDLGVRSTQTSARTIKPLLEALSTTGSGRLEIVQDAVTRDLFRDLRLIGPAVRAIDDAYPDIADLIVKQVLPIYGIAILPDLRASYDLKSKSAGHVRRLTLMHRLDPAGSRELVEQTLAEGSKELKVAAIECLGESEADIGYLLEQCKAKAKDVRSAALRALMRAPKRGADGQKALLKAIEADDIELLAMSFNDHRNAELDQAVVAQLSKQVERLFEEKDPKHLGPAMQRAIYLSICLRGCTDSGAEQLLLALFAQNAKLEKLKATPSGADFNEAIAWCMALAGDRVKQHLADHALHASGDAFQAALQAAHDVYPPEKFFQIFQTVLPALSKKRGAEQQRAQVLASILQGHRSTGSGYFNRFAEQNVQTKQANDPRWLDQALALKHPELVCALLTPSHTAAMDFLATLVTSTEPVWTRIQALETLARFAHPNATDLLVKLLQTSKTDDWQVRYGLQRVIPRLPLAAVATLEAAIPAIPAKLVDDLIDAISDLKLKSEGHSKS